MWKDIENYEGLYQVNELGEIKSKRGILKPFTDKDGYLKVGLHKNGIHKQFFVHRLVAKAFISNPDNLPEINHKDENKSNNTVSNLEWCTRIYNINYGSHNEREAFTKSNRYNVYDEFNKLIVSNGTFKTLYQTLKHSAKTLNSFQASLVMCAKGKRRSAYGYRVEYAV